MSIFSILSDKITHLATKCMGQWPIREWTWWMHSFYLGLFGKPLSYNAFCQKHVLKIKNLANKCFFLLIMYKIWVEYFQNVFFTLLMEFQTKTYGFSMCPPRSMYSSVTVCSIQSNFTSILNVPPRLLINKTRQINLIGAPNLYSHMLYVSLSLSLLYHFYHFEIVTNNIILL